uniref:Uncharacterized protein n=1 Tax=Anguilla anguilla TaxID=7936 RepID=A0A0E9XIB1_ANGAN
MDGKLQSQIRVTCDCISRSPTTVLPP